MKIFNTLEDIEGKIKKLPPVGSIEEEALSSKFDESLKNLSQSRLREKKEEYDFDNYYWERAKALNGMGSKTIESIGGISAFYKKRKKTLIGNPANNRKFIMIIIMIIIMIFAIMGVISHYSEKKIHTVPDGYVKQCISLNLTEYGGSIESAAKAAIAMYPDTAAGYTLKELKGEIKFLNTSAEVKSIFNETQSANWVIVPVLIKEEEADRYQQIIKESNETRRVVSASIFNSAEEA